MKLPISMTLVNHAMYICADALDWTTLTALGCMLALEQEAAA